MKIKQYYSRQELEGFSVHRIKRMFRIPRQARFAKMRLIEKVMQKMDEIYPQLPKAKPDRLLQSNVTVSLWGIASEAITPDGAIYHVKPDDELTKSPILSRKELEAIRWQRLMKMYSIKCTKGINKQVAIEGILAGQYVLDDGM